MKIDELVSIYIRLRDRRAARKKEYDEADAADKASQEKIEAKLLTTFNENGLTTAGCELGTAYTSTRTSATVADWETLLEFIRKHDSWAMLEHRVSKKAVEDYMAANEELPPGVSISREVVVNIRRK
ncbi:MAG: hypothetical protein KGL39_36220 [Patescibacteria group bacterium]|nr:hypothetical protein [Patescibacteria group bacterium]